ncbi:MAG: EAL domain-containing protein, partial [Lachnospiraceae bacterium]|nr:EAL domain-containing protein [Lachnospiraceae bacterium]
ESAYTSNPYMIREAMKNLQRRGFTILMDDFGSGYSSLNVLKDIAVDVLKIDMKFMSDTEIPGRGENILASVVRMAKLLEMPVIAEGVEKEHQVKFLKEIGCEYVQGFYYAKPMPSEQYEQLVFAN